jgi:hypothetical protein
MWFDDDSCLAPDCDISTWLPRVLRLLDNYAMIGSLYRQRLLGDQADWDRGAVVVQRQTDSVVR